MITTILCHHNRKDQRCTAQRKKRRRRRKRKRRAADRQKHIKYKNDAMMRQAAKNRVEVKKVTRVEPASQNLPNMRLTRRILVPDTALATFR